MAGRTRRSTTMKKRNRLVGEISEKFNPKATINLTGLETSIKIFPSLFYSSWKMATKWNGGVNNSRWRLRRQTNAFLLGGWSLKPAPSRSWDAGQNHTAGLMRDGEETEDGAWSSAVTTLRINNASVGHMQLQMSCASPTSPPPHPTPDTAVALFF